MASSQLQAPAFGQADLSNCEREQIHLAASIQPHGALLVVGGDDFTVQQASSNAARFLGFEGCLVGRRLGEVDTNLFRSIRPHLENHLSSVGLAVRCRVGDPPSDLDGLVHRSPEGAVIIELENAGPTVELSQSLEGSLKTITKSSSLDLICENAAEIFKTLTGYDRVMVYRFDEDGHGQVVAERREPELEPYLGNHYPASDIPQIARRLYERNRIRVLVDVEYEPALIEPRFSPITGADLDMSFCFLRSMSPIHIQYLKNMGVAATLVVSLMVGGKLWGLVACHHYRPRFVHFEIRAVCEVLAEAVGTRITAVESFSQVQAELSVRRLEQRMIESIARDGDWRAALFGNTKALLEPLEASGAALLFEGQVLTAGDVPATRQIRAIGEWLDGTTPAPVHSTNSLGNDIAEFQSFAAIASGLIAARLSNGAGEYLLWFRPEQVRTVTWGGNPLKPVTIGNNPSDLSPRRSFARWHQLVEGTGRPWTPADLTAAKLIGETVADVVVQFRSLRMLIVEDQLEQVSHQLQISENPVVIADAKGRVFEINTAVDRLLPIGHAHVETIADLPEMFTDPIMVRQRLEELMELRRPWRGEAALKNPGGAPKQLLIRADPVYSSAERLLGVVVLFTDLTERNAINAARREFQDRIFKRRQNQEVRLDSDAALFFRRLLGRIVENAQLAAFEITDGGDTRQMAELLESVHASVTRTADLLERLIWHATRTGNEPGSDSNSNSK